MAIIQNVLSRSPRTEPECISHILAFDKLEWSYLEEVEHWLQPFICQGISYYLLNIVFDKSLPYFSAGWFYYITCAQETAGNDSLLLSGRKYTRETKTKSSSPFLAYIVQLAPRSKQSLSLKVWTKDEY